MSKGNDAVDTIRLLEFWPEADRQAWIVAYQPAERLKPGGAASHLRPVTRDDLTRRYGYFLDFLRRRGLLSTSALAAENVTPENVAAYIAELKAHVSSVTVYGSIFKLRRASQLICPARDFTWLSDIERDLASDRRPRSKFDRLVLTGVLLEAGLTLFTEAETATNLTDLERARQARNGLMVALLALCPIRLKNFVALEIGSSIVEIKGQWWIALTALQTKEKRADERPVDHMLNSALNRFITTHRPILARGASSSALWLSSNDGQPMRKPGVYSVITSTTLSTVGVAVCPHMFRTAAASTAAVHGHANLHLGPAVLNHIDPRVTEEHYNRASSASAGQSFREVIRDYRKSVP
jgi:site-specific recombinase XerD